MARGQFLSIFSEQEMHLLRRGSAGVLTFYPTCQIFLPRLTAHARIYIACFFLRGTIFNVSELL